MKLKKIFTLTALTLLVSCNDAFFETTPPTQISTSEVFSSENNIDAFVNGAMRFLMENSTSQDNPGLPTIFLTPEAIGEAAFACEGRYGYRHSASSCDPFDNSTRRALFFWT